MFYKAIYPSPLGGITLVCDESTLVSLTLPGQREFPHGCATAEHPILTRAKHWLDAYFSGEAPSPADLPLRPEGTAFRTLVWDLLLEIPYGKTVSYGDLTKKSCGYFGQTAHVRPGGGAGRGGEPHRHRDPLPPRIGCGRQPDGLCRRHPL